MRHRAVVLLALALSCASLVGCSAAPRGAGVAEPDKAPPDPLHGLPFVTCRAWAIADGRTGRVLNGSNENEPLAMASTTKLMTALIIIGLAAADPAVLQEQVSIPELADKTTGSTADVRTGEKLSVHDMLYAMMLPSGNDAANALAEHFNARFAPPSPEEAAAQDRVRADNAAANSPWAYDHVADDDPRLNFIAQMNRTAARLGMAATHYSCPHGRDASDHVTAAADLLRLAHAAWRLPLLRQVVGTQRYTGAAMTPEGDTRRIEWTNTNQLLGISGYDGIKTGTTSKAGACLVSSGRRGDDHLFIAVLGATSGDARYADTRNLFRWGWLRRGHR